MNIHKNNQDQWNPAQYEKFKKERSQPFLDLIQLLKGSQFNEAIDLGCGTGEMTQHFVQTCNVKNALGLDSSDEMLKKAKSFELTNLKFSKGLIEEFKPQEKYDVIISNAAIQWCDQQKEVLRNIVMGLKNGGELAIQMPYNFDYITHTLAEEIIANEYPQIKLRGNPMLSLQDYTHYLYKLGLRNLNCFIKVYVHELKSKQDVYEWVKGTLLTHYQSQLTPIDFDKFCRDYRQKLEGKLSDESPFFYPFKRIFLYGKKN